MFPMSSSAMNTIGSAGTAGGLSTMGGIGLGLGAASGVANWISQQNTNTAQSDMQDKQIAWENLWRSNAHQTEVADLKKAGLNPILSAGGQGASSPSPGLPSLTAPQIHMPDLFTYGVSLKQLDQMDQRLAIDRAATAASIAKDLSGSDLNKAQTILAQKGLIRANLEGQISGAMAPIIRKIIGALKQNATGTDPKQLQPSSTWDDEPFLP